MSLKDRGTIKWTSIMLPEHVEMLKEVFEEQDHVEKPIIDEQQRMENDLVLQTALHDDLEVEIKYFKDHGYHTIKGNILFIDHINEVLRLDKEDVKLGDVVMVNLA